MATINIDKITTVNELASGYNYALELDSGSFAYATNAAAQENHLYLQINGSNVAGTLRKASIDVVETFSAVDSDGTPASTAFTIGVGDGDGSTLNGGTSADGDAYVAFVDAQTASNEGKSFQNTGTDIVGAFGKAISGSGNGNCLSFVAKTASSDDSVNPADINAGRARVLLYIDGITAGQ